MRNEVAIKQARYIFTNGKLIHDRIMQIQGRYLASCDDGLISDLSISQLHVVRIVWKNGELSMRELADHMAVSPPSASAMVDRLVEKKILCREHSTADRRKVVVRVSPQAVEKAQALEASIINLFVDLVQKIGPETAQKWCEVLKNVKEALADNA